MTKLFKQGFQWKETKCTLLTDVENAIPSAIASIKRHRAQLEKYIQKNPRFLYSLRPVHVNKGPRITKLMAEAAKKANVGPMAAVAGVLADLAVEALITAGSTVAVVENGGEIAAVSNKPVDVALSAGDSRDGATGPGGPGRALLFAQGQTARVSCLFRQVPA